MTRLLQCPRPTITLGVDLASEASNSASCTGRLSTSADPRGTPIPALVTRAAALGLTPPPDPADRARAALEGWIALPPRGSRQALITHQH